MSTAHRPGADDLDATFVALSDATRREIIRNLLQKPRRAGELADMVSMSPQALSRHLRLMRKAGLVVEEGIDSDARVRVYSVHPDAFAPCNHGWRKSKMHGVANCRRSRRTPSIPSALASRGHERRHRSSQRHGRRCTGGGVRDFHPRYRSMVAARHQIPERRV